MGSLLPEPDDLLETCIGDGEIAKARGIDQPHGVCDMCRVEVASFKRNVRVSCRQQRQSETLTEAEFENPARAEGKARGETTSVKTMFVVDGEYSVITAYPSDGLEESWIECSSISISGGIGPSVATPSR